MDTKKISILMGSDSDLPIMIKATDLLDKLAVPYEITVLSAHRTPELVFEYAENAHKRGIKIIIAAAGGAAHLAGIIAALTPLPVIGVPIKTSTLQGMDSLLSTLQMPAGIPVATMAINGAENAGLFALKILALSDDSIQKKLEAYKQDMKETVKNKSTTLQQIHPKEYIDKFLS